MILPLVVTAGDNTYGERSPGKICGHGQDVANTYKDGSYFLCAFLLSSQQIIHHLQIITLPTAYPTYHSTHDDTSEQHSKLSTHGLAPVQHTYAPELQEGSSRGGGLLPSCTSQRQTNTFDVDHNNHSQHQCLEPASTVISKSITTNLVTSICLGLNVCCEQVFSDWSDPLPLTANKSVNKSVRSIRTSMVCAFWRHHHANMYDHLANNKQTQGDTQHYPTKCGPNVLDVFRDTVLIRSTSHGCGQRTNNQHYFCQNGAHLHDRCEQLINRGTFTHGDVPPAETLRQQGIEHQPGPDTAGSINSTTDTGTDNNNNDNDDIHWLYMNFFAHTTTTPLQPDETTTKVIFETQNLASLRKHLKTVGSRQVHVAALQEISLDNHEIGTMRAALAKLGWESNISCTCPEHSKATAGVATVVRKPGTARRHIPKTKEFEDAILTGRISITTVCVNATETVYCINCYGWTNGHNCKATAARTDALFQALQCELPYLASHPMAIFGDINADIEDLPTLAAMVQEGWTDVGGVAHWWGNASKQPTCQAPNATNNLTRRDYIIACPMFLPYITSCNVVWTDNCSIHAAVQIAVDFNKPEPKVFKHIKPQSLSDTVDRIVAQHANTCTDKDDDEAMKKAKESLVNNIKQEMDKHVSSNLQQLQHTSANNNTNAQWRCISRCIERGFIDGTHSDDNQARRMKGHGKPKIKRCNLTVKLEPNQQPSNDDEADACLDNQASGFGKQATRCLTQSRRLQQIINRLRRQQAGYPMPLRIDGTPSHAGFSFDEEKKDTLKRIHDQMNIETKQAIIKHTTHKDIFEANLVRFLQRTDINEPSNSDKLAAFVDLYSKADATASQ